MITTIDMPWSTRHQAHPPLAQAGKIHIEEFLPYRGESATMDA
jgi:hypothetical protein